MQKSEYLPHTALVYANTLQRNRLIESYVVGPKKTWASLTVMSAQPDADTSYFMGRVKAKRKRRSLPFPTMVDVGDLLEREANPARAVTSILYRARPSKRAEPPPLIIGDWTHAAYDRFEVILAVERREKGTTNNVCCYRGEGFWSLPPEQIAEVCELHDRVIFGPVVFEMH